MRETRTIMGMPITVEIVDPKASEGIFDEVFSYFEYVDEKFSPYKEGSELSLLNSGAIAEDDRSEDMRLVLELAEETKRETGGYFDVRNREGLIDPSGLVKGWAIRNAARIIAERGYENFFVDAGGDVTVRGKSGQGQAWTIGIRNPFARDGIVKVVRLENRGGIATSGTYVRGQHIWNPKDKSRLLTDLASVTVIGPDVYDADRFATAAFAMGREGANLIERLPGLEGYFIDKDGMATMTSGFEKYVA